MKTTLPKVISFLCMASILLSCTDDGDGENTEVNLDNFIGVWNLVSVTVSEQIDTNDDGILTSNLLTEVDCLREQLLLNANSTWSSTEVSPSVISPITGNLYNVSCTPEIEQEGTWAVSAGTAIFFGQEPRSLVLQGNQLIQEINAELPGLVSLVYQRQ